jgi:hypothetical protein
VRKPPKPNLAFSEAEKARVTAECERLIADFMKPRFPPEIRATQFTTPSISSANGAAFNIASSSATAPAFRTTSAKSSAPFARLDWISRDRFDIQWHRHTGQWWRLHSGLTLDEAIAAIKADGHLHPL